MRDKYHTQPRASTNSVCQAALHYTERGFSVIPVEPRGKKPLVAWEEYQTRAAAADEIKNLFSNPSANVAIVTGKISGLVVIDVDSETAREELKLVVPDYDLDAVPRARTGRGWQLFFAHPGTSTQNRAGVIPGLDIRGDGGYVVVPPSIHPNGKQYKWEVPLADDLPKLPAELFKLITEPQEQTYRTRFNTAAVLNGVPQGRRDEMLFKLSCKLRNADVPQDIAAELILEAARHCEPPFSEKIALEKVARVYAKYQARDNGTKQPEFWPNFLTAKDILSAPQDPTRWLWENCLPLGGCSILVAKPKLGKSTLAANLALAIARGIPFLNRATQQAGVAYVSLDASLPEMADLFTRFGLRESDPIFLHTGSAPKDCVAWIMQHVRESGVRLVIIDTLQWLFKFQDVNDYSQVNNAMDPMLDAARSENIHVCFLHHARKDSADDLDAAIGSTAIRGLAYTYIHLKRLPNSEQRILRSDQRGGRNFSEVAIGFDRTTGWLQVKGTMEDAEIEETEPKVLEFLESEGGEVVEKAIRKALPVRTIIVSKALRKMFRIGKVQRVGQGRKGSPFRYSLMASLLDSVPGDRVLGEGDTGTECKNTRKTIAESKEMLFPGTQEQNGNSKEQNPKAPGSGTESEDFIVEWEETL